MSSGGHGLDFAVDISLLELHSKEATPAEAETHGAPLGLEFNSLTLNELNEDLDRRTKGTRRLQEEVETETREALEKFGCFYRSSSPAQSVRHANDSTEGSGVPPAHQQLLTRHFNQYGVLKEGRSFRMDKVDEDLQQLSDVNKFAVSSEVGKERTSSQRELLNLQEKPHEVQMENLFLSDLRLKDSRKHGDQMESMLEEVQSIKRSASQKLLEMEEEATALHSKVGTLERTIKEVCQSLWENPNRTQHNLNEGSEDGTGKLEDGFSKLQKQPESEDHRGPNKQERIQEVISSLGQEVAMLTDRLSSSKDSAICLSIKMEQLKKLLERQTSLHKRQVCFLEQRLSQTRLRLFGSQTEGNRTLQSLKVLQAQLGLLKTCCELQTLEFEGDAQVLKEQLEGLRKQLCKVWEDKTSLQILLEQRSQSQELLQRKYQELQVVLQETQQHLSSQCQTMQAEREDLRLELEDKEKTINDLKLQMENSSENTAEHSQTMERLQQENSLFIKQLEQQKLEIQQLRVELIQHKSDLAAAERESRRLQNQKVQEESLEKQQLKLQQMQQMQLLTLTKEHKELEELHGWKNDQHAGVVLKLQSQLRSAQVELEKIRQTLKTLEGAKHQGLQAAFNMQTEVTSRGEQVDALQSRIKHLEEEEMKLQQEKRLQNLELQKVSVFKEERRQLEEELKSLRSKDQQFQGRISQMEAMLHKMLESFRSCQDFIQLREQDYIRLKLQHALDLKELQAQNVHFALSTPPPDVDSATSPADAAPPLTPQASNTQNEPNRQQENCRCKLRCSAGDLHGGVAKNHRPHKDQRGCGSSSCRRRSAPARENTATHWLHSKQEVNFGSKFRRKTFCSDLHLLQTSDLKQRNMDQSYPVGSIPATGAKSSSFLHQLSLGRKSPVHSLLTSRPSS